MPGKRTPVADQEAEIAQLEATGRGRALTRPESDRLATLLYRQQLRNYRIEERLRRARQHVAMLERMALAA